MNRKTIFGAVTLGLLALAAPAQAHVTLNPTSEPAGAETELQVRVPNEQEKANTTKLALQFPPGFVEASNEPVPGWTARVQTRKLAKPVQTDDGPVSEEVSQITWTGTGPQGKIAPGQYQDFPVLVLIPDKPGTALTWKALQTYDNGDVVRWIGPPNSEEPAPQVKVTAAQTEGAATSDAGTAQASSSNGDGASKGLGITALVVAALGLTAGSAALLRGRGK